MTDWTGWLIYLINSGWLTGWLTYQWLATAMKHPAVGLWPHPTSWFFWLDVAEKTSSTTVSTVPGWHEPVVSSLDRIVRDSLKIILGSIGGAFIGLTVLIIVVVSCWRHRKRSQSAAPTIEQIIKIDHLPGFLIEVIIFDNCIDNYNW